MIRSRSLTVTRHARLPRGQLRQRLALRGQPPLAVAKLLLGRVRGVEQPVDGGAELSQIAAGAALFEPGRPVVGVEDFERARTHLVDPLDQSKPEHARDEQRDPEHQPADEQELFEERRNFPAVPGPLDQVETHEADHEQNDDDDASLQHAGTENSLTTAKAKSHSPLKAPSIVLGVLSGANSCAAATAKGSSGTSA